MTPPEILIVLLVLTFIIFRRWMDTLIEAIDNFKDNFPGGPTTPMHPLPSNDGALLRRRFRKTEN